MAWRVTIAPADRGGIPGWMGQLDRCWRNGNKYVVMSRKVRTDWGTITHVCIRSKNREDLTWEEKQKIKSALFGRENEGLEIYPAESKRTDGGGMYHLWVLPDGVGVPFGLHPYDKKGDYVPRGK